MGRCKSLVSLKSFLWYAPYLLRASTVLFSILNPLRVHSWGRLQWLMAWWLQHPFFTDMAGDIFLSIPTTSWEPRKILSFHFVDILNKCNYLGRKTWNFQLLRNYYITLWVSWEHFKLEDSVIWWVNSVVVHFLSLLISWKFMEVDFFPLKLSVHAKSEIFKASKWDQNALQHILSKAMWGEERDRPF